jgi:hypothetical protein
MARPVRGCIRCASCCSICFALDTQSRTLSSQRSASALRPATRAWLARTRHARTFAMEAACFSRSPSSSAPLVVMHPPAVSVVFVWERHEGNSAPIAAIITALCDGRESRGRLASVAKAVHVQASQKVPLKCWRSRTSPRTRPADRSRDSSFGILVLHLSEITLRKALTHAAVDRVTLLHGLVQRAGGYRRRG